MTSPGSLIEIRNLSKQYGNKQALCDVSLDVPAGEILAVIGINGAGKTTLLHLVAGLLFASSGSISISGLDRWKQNFEIRNFSTFVPANALAVGETRHPLDFLKFIGEIYGVEQPTLTERIDSMAKAMNYEAELNKDWGTLSLGHGKKALLIAAFLPDAQLRIMDEPFAGGIDPLGMETLYAWMEQARSRGETIIFSTQVLDQAEDFADRLLLLDEGKIKFLGTPVELMNQANVSPEAPRALAKAFMSFAEAK